MTPAPYTTEDMERLREELEKGQPFSRVKQKARYLLSTMKHEMNPDLKTYDVIQKLIESAPQQTLDALCEVLDDDS